MADRDRPSTDHVTEQQLGGRARRSPALRLVPVKPGVPPTMADCPTDRPCPYVQCKHHMQGIDVQDLAGRPRTRKGGGRARAVLDGVDPSRPSCLFDDERVQRGEPMSAREIAARERVTERQVRRIVRRGLAKLARTEEGRELLRELLGAG